MVRFINVELFWAENRGFNGELLIGFLAQGLRDIAYARFNHSLKPFWSADCVYVLVIL